MAYFGRLKKYKSVDHLLYAFKSIRQKMNEAELLIIGEGDDRQRLEQLVRRLEIQDAVRFTGFVSEAEKVALLQQAWFLVNTSSKEGWGLTVIESNACGTPVIAGNVPGLRDSIKDHETGLLYEYGNIAELEKKMFLLLNDYDLRKRLTVEAHKWSLTFDWSVSAEKMIMLLQQKISSIH